MVATAAEQMSSTSHEVAQNTASAADSAKKADTDAQAGSHKSQTAMKGIQHLVQNLNNSAQVIQTLLEDTGNISMVLDVISEISEQTNLLALNAAIEAARAGDQVSDVAAALEQIKNEIVNIHSVLTQVASASEQQSATANEIANSISSISHISEKISDNTVSLQQAGSDLVQVTQSLDRVVSVFRAGNS